MKVRNIPGKIELRENFEKIPRGPISKLVRGVFSRYPTRYVKNSTRRSRVEFLTYRLGYRAKLHELPFPRISPNTTRRSRVVFGLIRGNGNECNFAQMACRMANWSQVVFVINTTNKITNFDYFNVILGSIYNIPGVYILSRSLISFHRSHVSHLNFFHKVCGVKTYQTPLNNQKVL